MSFSVDLAVIIMPPLVKVVKCILYSTPKSGIMKKIRNISQNVLTKSDFKSILHLYVRKRYRDDNTPKIVVLRVTGCCSRL